MGYNTDFSGILYFQHPLEENELEILKSILGEDCRDHADWSKEILSLNQDPSHFTYIDLELTANKDGIIWNGAEKSYDMVDKIRLVINLMNLFADFELNGRMIAQGESIDDRWEIVVNGKEIVHQFITDGVKEISCPHCHMKFKL